MLQKMEIWISWCQFQSVPTVINLACWCWYNDVRCRLMVVIMTWRISGDPEPCLHGTCSPSHHNKSARWCHILRARASQLKVSMKFRGISCNICQLTDLLWNILQDLRTIKTIFLNTVFPHSLTLGSFKDLCNYRQYCVPRNFVDTPLLAILWSVAGRGSTRGQLLPGPGSPGTAAV